MLTITFRENDDMFSLGMFSLKGGKAFAPIPVNKAALILIKIQALQQIVHRKGTKKINKHEKLLRFSHN